MKDSSSLLLDRKVLMVRTKLAVLIGLNEAIALQQLYYWMERAKDIAEENNIRRRRGEPLQNQIGVFKDGRWWIYNTYNDWKRTNFPFWSVKTIQRTFDTLREMGIVLAERLGSNNRDQTRYYTIDFDRLEWYEKKQAYRDYSEDPEAPEGQSKPDESPAENETPPDSPFGQNDQMEENKPSQNDQMGLPDGQNDQMQLDKMTRCNWSTCPTVNIESKITSSQITQGGKTPASQMSPEKAWQATCDQLKMEMAPGLYRQYIGDLQFGSFQNGIFNLTALDPDRAAWARSRLGAKINGLLTVIIGQQVSIEFTIRQPADTPARF